jgi:hypothetical protein
MNDETSQRPQNGDLYRFFRLLLLLCIGGFFLARYLTSLASTFQSNIAWINLKTYLHDETAFTNNMVTGVALFSQAVGTNDKNQSAKFGLGMSYALQGDVDSAIITWSKSEIDPATLIEYGISARNKGILDAALTQFRAADALDDMNTQKAYLLAGTICQRANSMQHLLSEPNVQYCSSYLSDNGNDLIVNGDFSTRAVYGWEGEHFFTGKNAARLQIEDLDESEDYVVSLMGQDKSNHYGLYQRISLVPGTTVRFSGRFRISGEENLKARVLYIGWQEKDGTPQGNHGEQHSQEMEWTKFERTFHVPENISPPINFYPVIFSGEGTVWFDDIQLEIILD